MSKSTSNHPDSVWIAKSRFGKNNRARTASCRTRAHQTRNNCKTIDSVRLITTEASKSTFCNTAQTTGTYWNLICTCNILHARNMLVLTRAPESIAGACVVADRCDGVVFLRLQRSRRELVTYTKYLACYGYAPCTDSIMELFSLNTLKLYFCPCLGSFFGVSVSTLKIFTTGKNNL